MQVTVDGVNLMGVKWYDNKPVHLLSTFVGAHPTTEVKSWGAKTKTKTDVQCCNHLQAVYGRS